MDYKLIKKKVNYFFSHDVKDLEAVAGKRLIEVSPVQQVDDEKNWLSVDGARAELGLIKACIIQLDGREQELMKRRYLLNQSYTQMTAELYCSDTTIARTLSSACAHFALAYAARGRDLLKKWIK